MSAEKSQRIQKRHKWWKEHKEKDSDVHQEGTAERQEKEHVPAKLSLVSESKKGFRSSLHILQKVEETGITDNKARNKRKQKDGSGHEPLPKRTDNASDLSEEDLTAKDQTQQKGKKSVKRLVLFVGNLPFKANKENVQKHFEKCGKIVSLRFPVDKETEKAKGYAFIEFEDKWAFKRGLLLHNTKMFGRVINVEFTSIGGNSQKRKDKLRRKNLNLARFKRKRPQESTS